MKAKRSLSLFLTLIMLLSIFPVQYVAAADDAGPALSIESKSATPGSTVTINISILDNPGIVAADLRLEFDEALTLVETEAGKAFSALSFTPPRDMSSPCILSWAGESVTDEQIQDGTIVTLTFMVSENAEVDTTANLTISCDSANDNDLYPVEIAVAEGAISIVDFMYGDVDNNFKINAADMTLIQRYLADGGRNNNENGYNVNINEKAADTFLDNKISAADVTVLKRWKAQWKDYESLPYSPPAHAHSLKYVEEKPATESTEGMMAHYKCSCGKLFRDATCTEEVSREELIIPIIEAGKTYVQYNLYGGDDYLRNVGIENPNPSEFISEKGMTLSPLTAPAGYEFKGWRLVDGTDEGTPVTKLEPQQPGTAIEVRAVFNPIKYSITYVNYKTPVGEVINQEALYYYVNQGKPNLPNPEVKNYIFLGWYDQDGKEVESIPVGTTGDIVLDGYWTSLRNLAKAKPLQAPIILDNTSEGVIYFAYELGTIENIPVSDAIWTLQSVAGLEQQVSTTVTTSISSAQASSIADTISKETVDSGTWTLSEEWNNTTHINESWAEERGMTVAEAESHATTDSNTFSVTNSQGGTSATTTTEGATVRAYHSDDQTNETGSQFDVSINGKYTNSTEVSASASVKAPLGIAKAEASTGVKNTSTFEIGGSVDYSNYNKNKINVRSETEASRVDTNVASNTSTWNKDTTTSNTHSASTNTEFQKALSQVVSSEKGYGKTYAHGGSGSTSQGFSTSASSSVNSTSSLSYSIADTKTTTTTYSSDGRLEGSYRLVVAGTAHVFGVVGYDVASRSYFTYTFSVMDDKKHEFLDYTPKGSNFDDAENSVLPFEIPYFVYDYVTEATAMTEGLQYRTNTKNGTATIVGYTGESADITVPAYISAGNTAYKVTGISAAAFAGKSIRSVMLSRFVEEVPSGAFKGCTALEEISGCFTKIGSEAFSGCTSLDKFNVSENVISIGGNAFSGVRSITVNAISANAALTAAQEQMPDAGEEEQRQAAKDLTKQLINSAVQSGAQEVVLDLSEIMDGAELTLDVPAISKFELNGGRRTYTNFELISDARETVLREISIENYTTIPLRINSKQLTLEVVTVDSSGFAMTVGMDQPTITLRRDSTLTSLNGKAVVFKDPEVVAAVVDSAVGVLNVSGNVYVYGDIKGQDNLEVYDGQIIRLSQGGDQFISGAFTINFDANGGSVTETSRSVGLGQLYGSLPVPTRPQYQFDNWYTEATGGVPVTADMRFEEFNDITLYAHWTLNKFSISLNANGGSVSQNLVEVIYNEKIGELPIPTRAGFVFDGWYTAANGGERYTADTVFPTTNSIVLYAHWLPEEYTVSWSAAPNCTITVKRTGSPYGGADTATLSSGAKVYYGDKLSVTYKANTGYSINTSGSSSITVTGNVTGTDIYATAKANSYTYTIKYRSSNGTALGSSSVSNTFGSSKTVSAPAKSGYNTPASQTVKWDATSKTITFTYTPTSVASEVRSGTISNSPYMTYYTTFEHRNRTANSVQIRVVWETTIAARNYTVYGQKFTASSGSASTGVVQVAAFNTWGSAVSSGRAATGTSNWITVPVNTTNSTLVDISVYYYQTNSNNLDMYKYNGTAAVSKVWSIRIPAY